MNEFIGRSRLVLAWLECEILAMRLLCECVIQSSPVQYPGNVYGIETYLYLSAHIANYSKRQVNATAMKTNGRPDGWMVGWIDGKGSINSIGHGQKRRRRRRRGWRAKEKHFPTQIYLLDRLQIIMSIFVCLCVNNKR